MQNEPNSFDVLSFVTRIPEIDAEYAIKAIGGSENFFALLSQMTRVMPLHIKQMDEHISSGDLSLFRVKVHGVKGSMRQAGHLHMARSAEFLEKEAAEGNMCNCREYYAPFRDELLGFLEQLSSIFNNTGKSDRHPVEPDDINGYSDTLTQVKTALEGFDSLLAAELLRPLAAKRFGGGTDAIIANIYNELEMYRPEAALEYIAKLV